MINAFGDKLKNSSIRSMSGGLVVVANTAVDVASVYRIADECGYSVKPTSYFAKPLNDEVILMPGEKLTGELSLNDDDFYIEAPVTSTLSDIEEYLTQSDSSLYLPIICYNNGLPIGNIVATNAANFLAPVYGDIARLIMGVVAIRLNGDRIDTGRRSIKGVAGYNLSNAFIGSRGLEGLICRLRFRLFTIS